MDKCRFSFVVFMESNIEIVKYNPDHKEIWNAFVESSKNGTFLFNRDYMDYHSDRFLDFSLLVFRKKKLYCLLPANIREVGDTKVIYSHQGLTYGGLVMGDKCTAEGVMQVFDELKDYLKEKGITKFVYKPVPYIYHSLPSEEDLYALFRNDAKLIVRNISSTISLYNPLKLNKDRREAVRRAQRNGLYVKTSTNYDAFWKILEDNLMITYGAKPVHSLEEIKRLVDLFPDKIKIQGSFKKDENGEKMLAGIVCYLMGNTVHAQYISATPEGKKMGAVDLIVNNLIEKYKEGNSKVEYIDLVTSNEENGRVLNETLIYQKEGFGGRAVCYDTYEWVL